MTDSSINSADLVDFHCHLDLYPNYLEVIRECEDLRIKTLTVTNAPCVWTQNKMFLKDCQHIRAALGLHPQLAHVRAEEINLFEKYLPETRYVGEVGLDGSSDFVNTLEIQRKVFQKILELCSSAQGKILTVHSRRATREVIEMIENYLPADKGRVVLHWFTGSSSANGGLLLSQSVNQLSDNHAEIDDVNASEERGDGLGLALEDFLISSLVALPLDAILLLSLVSVSSLSSPVCPLEVVVFAEFFGALFCSAIASSLG